MFTKYLLYSRTVFIYKLLNIPTEFYLRVKIVDSTFYLGRRGSSLKLQLSGVHHRPTNR